MYRLKDCNIQLNASLNFHHLLQQRKAVHWVMQRLNTYVIDSFDIQWFAKDWHIWVYVIKLTCISSSMKHIRNLYPLIFLKINVTYQSDQVNPTCGWKTSADFRTVGPSWPPTAYKRPSMTPTPAPLLRVVISATFVHSSASGSYRSTLDRHCLTKF